MGVTKADIEAKINSKKVVVYAKSTCPYCPLTLAILNKLNLSADDFEWIDFDKDPDMSAIEAIVKELAGAEWVPHVFINGKRVADDLMKDLDQLQKNGQLQKMIDA